MWESGIGAGSGRQRAGMCFARQGDEYGGAMEIDLVEGHLRPTELGQIRVDLGLQRNGLGGGQSGCAALFREGRMSAGNICARRAGGHCGCEQRRQAGGQDDTYFRSHQSPSHSPPTRRSRAATALCIPTLRGSGQDGGRRQGAVRMWVVSLSLYRWSHGPPITACRVALRPGHTRPSSKIHKDELGMGFEPAGVKR